MLRRYYGRKKLWSETAAMHARTAQARPQRDGLIRAGGQRPWHIVLPSCCDFAIASLLHARILASSGHRLQKSYPREKQSRRGRASKETPGPLFENRGGLRVAPGSPPVIRACVRRCVELGGASCGGSASSSCTCPCSPCPKAAMASSWCMPRRTRTRAHCG